MGAHIGKFLKRRESRVLVVGDIHAPFDLETYLPFLKKTYKEFNCTRVVFIGDVIDNHYSSYHETDADGMGGGFELDEAVKSLKKYVKAFPEAVVCIGNHDRIISRKAQSGGIPKRWIRDYAEVLGAPEWKFLERVEIDGVMYTHGEGGSARTRMKKELKSVVQGHLHTQSYVEYAVGHNHKIFGMQVGCGIDHKAYAFAYGKDFGKPAISCGVVLGGHTPIVVTHNL